MIIIFTVFNKKTMEETKVYDVQLDNCGYPKFLIKENGQWLYRSAKHYITFDEHRNLMELEKSSRLKPCEHEWINYSLSHRYCKKCIQHQYNYGGTWV